MCVPRWFCLGPLADLKWKWFGGARGEEYGCVIVLGSKLVLVTDESPLALVAHVAALIASKCITVSRAYAGGYASPAPIRGVVLVRNSSRSLR